MKGSEDGQQQKVHLDERTGRIHRARESDSSSDSPGPRGEPLQSRNVRPANRLVSDIRRHFYWQTRIANLPRPAHSHCNAEVDAFLP